MLTLKTTRMIFPISLVILTIAPSFADLPLGEIDHGQGEMVGEVTQTSVILQSRLTEGRDLVRGDLPGASGVARFELADNIGFMESFTTPWINAIPDYDYIIKTKVNNLKPGMRYYYRLVYGPNRENTNIGETCTFRTLDNAEIERKVSFAVVTGMCYHFFHYGWYEKPTFTGYPPAYDRPDHGPYMGPDKFLGYPALETILNQRPDFLVGTGDNVYYDHPTKTAYKDLGTDPLGGWRRQAKTKEELRRKYHEQFIQPRFIDLFRHVPTYWMKDDHDYRFDDSDPYMDAMRWTPGDGLPSAELGVEMLREQLPVVDPKDENALTYRTHRINKLLQIWLIEGRDYRSPANMADGPQKSLWGNEQKEWLKRTLLASDATFKLLIHPTALVGPNWSINPGDNHLSPYGYKHEGNEFFAWLKENGFLEKNLYIVCGDLHCKYHALHPSGFEEFACGALVTANSIIGLLPGDPKSTDPDGLIKHVWHHAEPIGGFLGVTVTPGEAERNSTIDFTFYDTKGEELYNCRKTATNE